MRADRVLNGLQYNDTAGVAKFINKQVDIGEIKGYMRVRNMINLVSRKVLGNFGR